MICHFNDLVCEDTRYEVPTEALTELAEHIRTYGNMFPFNVTRKDGKFLVPSRQAHRYAAFRLLGEEFWNDIPIKVDE